MKEEVIKCFPSNIKRVLENLNNDTWSKIEEIRVGIDKPVSIFIDNFLYFINEKSELTKLVNQSIFTHKKDIDFIMEMITEGSVYAWVDKIKNGFLTLPYGHRVGITGTTVLENDVVKYIKNVSSLNFRIRHEIFDVSKLVIPIILNDNEIKNTLIISPPGCGKTTLLRDIARVLGNAENRVKVSIIDERNEIASSYNGVAQNNVGIFTNVLDSCPKSVGMMMAVRTMSPDVIITDEIGDKKDIIALNEASKCGVKIITSIHGYNINDIPVLLKNFFDIFIILGRSKGVGTVEKIIEKGD